MFEIKVTIEAPEIVGALNRLSDAMSISAGNTLIQHPHAQMEAEAEKTEPAAPTPVPVPVAPVPAPAPEPVPVPAATAPAPEPVPVPVAPAPAQTAPAPEVKPSQPKIDLDTISQAGAGLIDEGKMPEIMNLLKKYGVQAVTQLKPEQYTDFAADMRELGAKI